MVDNREKIDDQPYDRNLLNEPESSDGEQEPTPISQKSVVVQLDNSPFANTQREGNMVFTKLEDLVDVSNMAELEKFLLTPLPKGVAVQTRIYRHPTTMNTTFMLHTEDGKCILEASKTKNIGQSYFNIIIKKDKFDKEGVKIGRFEGQTNRRYSFFGTGESVRNSGKKNLDIEKLRRELLSINFRHFPTGIPGLRKITIALPKIDEKTNQIYACKALNPAVDGLAALSKNENAEKYVEVLSNKKATWDEERSCFVLSFLNGRVTWPSVKNFLIAKDDADQSKGIIYQFGRTGKNEFTCDFSHPFTPSQAFSAALGQFFYKKRSL